MSGQIAPVGDDRRATKRQWQCLSATPKLRLVLGFAGWRLFFGLARENFVCRPKPNTGRGLRLVFTRVVRVRHVCAFNEG